jgi:UDP-N-acetylmuramoylalanine--D-glutamate ligase
MGCEVISMSFIFNGRNILVAGAGVTGIAVAKVLATKGAHIDFVDENQKETLDFKVLSPDSIDVNAYSAIVVSPGWKPNHPIIVNAAKADIPLWNEIDLAWMISREITPQQKWLALTGTNGKTTTVEMTTAMLQSAGLRAIACGNVGETVIDAVVNAEPYDYLVLELSSFQLHWMQEAKFTSVAILNLADDHLDWHGSFENYCSAKFSLLQHTDIAILNAGDNEVARRAQIWQGRKIFYSLDTPAAGELGIVEDLLIDRAFVHNPQEASMIAQINDIQPTLPHSVSNALAAAGLALSVGVSYENIQKALIGFHPGRHRIEVVLDEDEILWIDDSKATNPHAAAASIMSHLSVIWVAGGLAKGADMNSFIDRVKTRLKAAILIGEDRGIIEAALHKFAPEIPIVKVDSDSIRGGSSNELMEKVVEVAKEFAKPGDTVLMAPACASMDQFISYADRGDRFAFAVKKLVQK